MKRTILAVTCLLLVGCSGSGGETADEPADSTPPTTAPGGASIPTDPERAVALASFDNRPVKVGCGMCIYEMPGVDSCTLAVHADGHSMLVTGVDLDLHDHDLCSREGRAVVSGEVVDGQLLATSVEIE